MRRTPIYLLLTFALLGTGCASGLNSAAERDLDRAAQALDEQLDAPGLLAATTLLFHETNGRYPATPFELLGSTEARETQLQALGLSALTIEPENDGVALAYTLLPSQADPSDRYGLITIAETDTLGTYDVELLLERVEDPDRGSGGYGLRQQARALPLTQQGSYAVVRARGSLCATVASVRERMASGAPVGDPPLESGRAYTVTFTDTRGAASELGEGYTVTLPR